MPSFQITSRRLLTKCVRCGREFETHEVAFYRNQFPADRFCVPCQETEQAEADQHQAETLFLQSYVPKNYRDCSFATFKRVPGTETAYVMTTAFAREIRSGRKPRRGLTLSGPPGSGKTHLAIAIIREVIFGRSIPSLFINVPEWLNTLRESFDDGPPVLSPREFALTVVDDLGAEQSTDWSKDQLYSLFNHRHANHLLTVITTNLSPSDLESRLGRPLMSRLNKMCLAVELTPHQDYRELQVTPGEF